MRWDDPQCRYPGTGRMYVSPQAVLAAANVNPQIQGASFLTHDSSGSRNPTEMPVYPCISVVSIIRSTLEHHRGGRKPPPGSGSCPGEARLIGWGPVKARSWSTSSGMSWPHARVTSSRSSQAYALNTKALSPGTAAYSIQAEDASGRRHQPLCLQSLIWLCQWPHAGYTIQHD